MEINKKPPFGGPGMPPPMGGMPPMGGKPPFDGPPPEMPEADISAYTNRKLDLRYGNEHPRQVFDIFYPEEGDGPFPVLLHMHGGGFALGDKRDFHIQELLDCTKHGYAFASCNYRRSGNAPFPAAVLDCRLFVDYLHSHAAELNIDAERICAFGGSAGGNLSALFAMNIEKFYGEEKPVNAKVACAIDWFGPTAFEKMDEQARANGISLADHDMPHSPESQYIGAPIQEADPAVLAAANPISYINDSMCPMLLQHGTMDVLVPKGQSDILYEAIVEKLGEGRVAYLPLEGAGHDGPEFKSEENLAIMYAFLDKHLKGIEPALPLSEMPLPKCSGEGAANAHFGLGGAMPPMPGPGGPAFDGPPPPGFEPPKLAQEILDGINEKYLDIAYCDESPNQILDLYLPEKREEKCPVIVHFHGGAFMMCTKRDDSVEPMLRGLERGYAVISAEYRKSGEARYPAMVYDAKAVIRWVRAHAEKYGFDTERIAVWGPSSGGWLSSYTAVTNDNPAFEDLSQGNGEYSSHVHACVDWCGPCAGFLEMDKAFRVSGAGAADHDEALSPESQFLGTQITKIPELCRLASPIAHVNKNTVPFFILHGGIDQVVPVEQSIAFAQAINAAVGEERAKLHIAEGKLHHGHPWYHEEWVSDMCLDFLDGIFKN
ncbi:MAG: alpha/beta hydrolase [Oscillospiraceae bacterium]|nr:alpha/beta hydrolase [Oscillospiraceae bacterium]